LPGMGGMDDDKDEQPPFRWNRQAVFMLVLCMFAMALPLGGVVWSLRGYLVAKQRIAAEATASPTPAKPAVDTVSLEKSLERVSDEQFASTVTLKEDGTSLELTVAPGDMAARAARIGELAKDAGGSALDMSDPEAKSRRLMVQVAASRLDLLKRAIRGERVDFSAIPAGAETQMLEVELRAP